MAPLLGSLGPARVEGTAAMNDASEGDPLCEEGRCQGFGGCDAWVRRINPAPQPESTSLLTTSDVSKNEAE